MHQQSRWLINIVAVVSVLIITAALLFPALAANREASRRMDCGRNVKMLSLGVQNYHDTYSCLPYGARNRTEPPNYAEPSTWGSSWLFATTVFCESRPLFSQVVAATMQGDYTSAEVRTVAHETEISYMICPSSPLPKWESLGDSRLLVPSYAGIMGASEHATGGPNAVLDDKQRLAAGPYGGWAAGNGLLLINQSLTFVDCTDGTANTILVGEVANWYFDDSGKRFNPALAVSDAGDGSHAGAAGWLAGTDLDYTVTKGGRTIPGQRVCNLITLAHPIGTNNRWGKQNSQPNWGASGVGRCGLNNPLIAAHPEGAMVGFLDGHVQLLRQQVDLHVIKRLGMRDDGEVIRID